MTPKYGIACWGTGPREFRDHTQVRPRRGLVGIHEVDISEKWLFTTIEEIPREPELSKTASIFHTNAAEIRGSPKFRHCSFDFEDCSDWIEVGLQVLNSVGWRVDSAVSHETNLERCIPPENKSGFFIIRNQECVWWSSPAILRLEHLLQPPPVSQKASPMVDREALGVLEVAVGVFFQDHAGASCAWAPPPRR